MQSDTTLGRFYRDLSLLVLLALAVVAVLVFQDYGITHDEEVQNIYGKMLLRFYASGFADRAAFDYLDLYRYGGLFDMAAALLNTVSPFGEYETRHLLGGLVGILGLAGAWKLGRLLGGERAGFLALVMLALVPAYWGHSFNNPKDGPFAAAMVWTLYYGCRLMGQLPRPAWDTVLKLGLVLGLALSVRVGALLMVCYMGLGVLLFLGLQARAGRGWGALGGDLVGLVRRALPGLLLAYVVMALFWPWAVMSPLNPIKALVGFSTYPIQLETLVEGEWVKASHLPPDYIPTYLLVNLPEFVLAGLAVAAGLAGWSLLRNRTALAGPRGLQMLLLALAAFFPVLFFVLIRPTAYNGLRHFLFVVPPMAVMAALALDRLWILIAARWHLAGRLAAAALTVALVGQVWVMVRLHPDQYVYFNSLTGGLKGAEGEFELDYWGNSLLEATRGLAEFVEAEYGGPPPAGAYKVWVCGHPLSAGYFFPPYLTLTKTHADADFLISFTQADCHKRFKGKQILAVERFGVALSVVKDRRALLGRPTPPPPPQPGAL